MRGISEADRRAIQAVGADVAAAEAVLAAACDGTLSALLSVKQVCEAAHLATARAGQVQRVLTALARQGFFVGDEERGWRFARSQEEAAHLFSALSAIKCHAESVNVERNTVAVVLSEPAAPSALQDQLRRSLRGTLGICRSEPLFAQLAREARCRFTVMTPFVDEMGAPFIQELFHSCRAPIKQLIVRSDAAGVLPAALREHFPVLAAAGVQVFDYRLERTEGRGRETFHAKVVLADDCCYVGSFNMTQWSMGHSLELGLSACGEVSRRIGDILDAITAIAEPLPGMSAGP